VRQRTENKLCRGFKLVFNFLISAVIFTYFIHILVFQLNPNTIISSRGFFLMYLNLFIFYGPLWFILMGIIFMGVQFFSEKKYPIGFFNPPTITYFLSFTILVISFILYLNYDYYFDFFASPTRFNFIRILLVNLTLVITGIVFVFFKKASKKWVQVVFLCLLSLNIIYSYISIISSEHQTFETISNREGIAERKFTLKEFTPRKIRIVLMDGLSLSLLKAFTAEEKLLNFNELIKNGVSGRIKTFKPNLNLSLLNSTLSGLKPSQFSNHSYDKFKMNDQGQEFEIQPRYIFFRKTPIINNTSFYQRYDNNVLDNISWHYENYNCETQRLIKPIHVDRYSLRALKKNNRFVLLFPDLLKQEEENDPKAELLKKFFFLDDYIKNMIPDLKDSNVYYCLVSLPGLRVISKYFFQYHMPQIFGTSAQNETLIKKYGRIIEKYYEYYDSIIGNLMSTTGDNELLVILSFFEYEPLPVWRRILMNLFGPKDIFVYKSLNSQGTILLYEKNALRRGYPLKSMSILDIYPTLLYYSGFQMSRDLQGEVIREIFTDDFLLNNPIDIHIDNRANEQ